MQATLLGLATAVILALVAALVGPYFVDWSQYSSTFEAEASRLVGMPVRVTGPIDVRLLPTPMLTLGNIEVGEDPAAPRLTARELHAELALGSLLRGGFRASDMRVVAPDIRLALRADGRFDWPAARVGFDPDRFWVEHLALEGGRLTLGDAASGATVTLEGLWFNGDVRSLLGPVKGEGGFTASGERYGYRIAAGRIGDDGAMRLRLGLDPSDHPLSIVADGAVRMENNAPRFEGTLALARPAAIGSASGPGVVVTPWRVTSRVAATPAQALFEQLEYQYGPDDRALKLAGTAEFRFGRNPRLDGVVSAHQADLDRTLDLPDAVRRTPFAALKQVIETLGDAYRPPMPVRLGIGIDNVTLAGGTLQNLRGDLKMEADGWDIETLEVRAPGSTQVRLSGRLAMGPQGVAFKGPARIEASDPKALAAWLEGRSETSQTQLGMLRVAGDLTIGTKELAVDRLRLEFDRKTIEGRLAYAYAADNRAARLEADLKAAELDVDGLIGFARAAFDGAAFDRPGEVTLNVDVGRATIAGVEAKRVSGAFKLDPAGLSFDRVQIGDLAGAAFNLNGRLEGPLSAPKGSVAFDVDARSLDGTAAVLAKFLPHAAEPLRRAGATITPLKARVTLDLARNAAGSSAKLVLDGTAGALRMRLSTEASGDVATLTLPEIRLDGEITAADGSVLVHLAGLDQLVAVDRRAGALAMTARGNGNDLRLDARLTAGGLNASANGTARLFAPNGMAAALDLVLQADAAPLRHAAGATPAPPLPVALRAHVNANADKIDIESMSGTIAGSPVRGNLKLAFGAGMRIEGRIDAEAVDVAALVAAAAGMPAPSKAADAPTWPAEPFGDGLFGDLAGRVEFTAARAAFTPTLTARQLRGAVRFGADEIAIEDLEGVLAGGRATGQLVLRHGATGLAATARLALVNADASAILPREGRPAINGRLGLQVEMEGSGLSPAALIGALSGSGTLTLEDATFAALDPKAFGAATRSADQAAAIDAAKIRDVVATVLDGGVLAIPRLDAALTITAGQARVGRTIVLAQGADLAIVGTLDLADATLDARLTLTGAVPADGLSTTRPDILVALKGPVPAPKRTVDVSALSGWLMLRSVDRQAKHIEAIEAERQREPLQTNLAPAVAPGTATPAPVPATETPAPDPAASPTSAVPEVAPPVVRPRRAVRPPAAPRAAAIPSTDQPPPLPPPLDIAPRPARPRPAATSNDARQSTSQRPSNVPPPPPPRSALDTIFGPSR